MKKAFLGFVLMALLSEGFGQSNIVASGGEATGNGGSVSFSVGQIAVQSSGDGSTTISEGVQQPYEIQTVGVDEYSGITLQAIVYPNPTQHSVQLRISNYEIPDNGLKAQLYDANGRLIEIYTISDLLTQFDLSRFPTATYQLRVMEGNRLLKTFKIVKHNF